ncbi:MAG TPA: tetratricopeptide repeat protein [Candidatus Eisenbacteria bacterium]|nr:tetratricopeptide repeat protein [Candidatus Eisenbacteria bacterium]
MATDSGITCPRCGERLPEGFTRCDACGAFLSAPAARAPSAPRPAREPRPPAKARPAPAPTAQAISGTAWIFLAAGLLCGGAIGYTLHGAVAPREEGGAPRGPADVMAGASAGQGMPQGQMPEGQMPQGQMPQEVAKMISEYRQRLATNPDDVDANIGMGNLYFDSSQWERAVDSYQRALDKAPGNADVRVDMAVALHNLGQNQKAKDEMERVTRESPEHRNAWLNLGVVSAQMGDRAGAVKAWEQYLKLDPNGPHSASIRAQIENMKRGS